MPCFTSDHGLPATLWALLRPMTAGPSCSCAWATVPFGPSKTPCLVNPKASTRNAIAACASSYRSAGKMLGFELMMHTSMARSVATMTGARIGWILPGHKALDHRPCPLARGDSGAVGEEAGQHFAGRNAGERAEVACEMRLIVVPAVGRDIREPGRSAAQQLFRA